MFDNIAQGRRLKKDDQKPGNVPFVMAGTGNAGVVGHISNPVASFPANSLTVDIFGNTFYRDYIFGAGDDTGVYWNNSRTYSKEQMLFMGIAIERFLQGKYSFGNKLRSSQSHDFKISLPVNVAGEIDFAFMDAFIRELEEERIRELAAYLKVSGLADSKLTASERKALDRFGKSGFAMFQLDELFSINKTSGFNSDRLVDGDEYDYITRTSTNQGILKSTGRVNGREVNPAGTWSLGLLQMDFFYRKKPWYAGQFVRKITPKIPMSELVCQFFTGIFNKQKKRLLSVLVRDVDITFKSSKVVLPVTASGLPDYDYMETFMRAVQKLVVKGVEDFTDKRILATKKCASTTVSKNTNGTTP